MSLRVQEYADINALLKSRGQTSDGGLFRGAVEEALRASGNTESLVLISGKLEQKLKDSPELAEDIYRRINEMCCGYGKSCRDNIVVVDRNGEIERYCPTHDKRLEQKTAEELKEIVKARARKMAKLAAYFKLVERIAVKRKLVEQENLKRAVNKKYRYSVTRLDSIVKSICQSPTKETAYYN